MGQKVNPISNRLGVIRGWDSNWSDGTKQGENILEDYKLRKYRGFKKHRARMPVASDPSTTSYFSHCISKICLFVSPQRGMPYRPGRAPGNCTARFWSCENGFLCRIADYPLKVCRIYNMIMLLLKTKYRTV